ncbi:unnamed protein product [Danaus chrysippus]|uniref:(African queen) hypothetical protein n=1 Tax=Danaus chrysippus TaxID=151541 RepID=A0A8J2W9R3_9NEOP|nr:unnamed protein product [Danaus chrysippus]
MCCFGAWEILKSSLYILSTGAGAYVVETNNLEWNTPFPAVTVCKHTDMEAVKQYLKKFQPIETEFGSCYVFNSALLNNASLLTVNRTIGLPDLVFHVRKIVAVRIHAPGDIVSGGMLNILQVQSVPLVTEMDVMLRAEPTINDESVKTLSEASRDCLFDDERPSFPDWPFEYYTRSACILYCRALAQMNRCNCTHHFLAKIVDMGGIGGVFFGASLLSVIELIYLLCIRRN